MISEERDTLTVVTDGKKHKRKTSAGEMESQATWKELTLELKTKGARGGEVTRVFRIGDDGRLEVVTGITFPRGGETIEIVTRYDEARAGQSNRDN